jgi:hypothetical protein
MMLRLPMFLYYLPITNVHILSLGKSVSERSFSHINTIYLYIILFFIS